MIDKIDRIDVANPTCPYCGYVFEQYNPPYSLNRNGFVRTAIDCPECNKEYACEVSCSVEFSSFPVVTFTEEDLQGYVKPESLTEDEKQFLAKGIK